MKAPTADIDCKIFFDAIASGDEAMFESFFEKYRGRVYSLVLKWTKSGFAAEEITQEVFISVWTGRNNLGAVRDAETYFYTIIYNKINRHLRKEANKERILKLALLGTDGTSNETEETVDVHDGERFVNQALERLSARKRLIYHLSRREGKSHDEIATVLRVSPHTVKSHLAHTLKIIRNYMKDNVLLVVWVILLLLAGKK